MRVAVFSAKNYERTLLDELNAAHRHELVYFDTLLGPDTTSLAAGFPAVSVFADDVVDGDVLNISPPAARSLLRRAPPASTTST
jgi:D-lactate dehydrogenase